jgi:hypothetical protein
MKKYEYIGIKEDKKPFRIQSVSVMKNDLDGLPKGKYKLTVAKYFKKASPPQFKWLYGSVYPLSLIALNEAGYEFTNVDQVDIFWKSMFANKEVLVRETGQIMTVPLSKSEFLTVDHMAYTSSIRTYCAEYLSANIPDPDVNWKQHKKEMQELIEKEQSKL